MDLLLNMIANLSIWCRQHLGQISLAMISVSLVLIGPFLGKYLQRLIGHMNIIFRVIIIAIVYMLTFGLIINYTPYLLLQLLTQLNNYSLFPVLLLCSIFIGMIADRH